MLQELSIKNFAVIKDVHVNFNPGMTVFTGETGAGKSMIIDAVHLLVGGRGSTSFVRHGEERCQLQALFYPDRNQDDIYRLLEEWDIDPDPSGLIIQRDIYTSGRQVSRINGVMVTIQALKTMGAYLVDIQGQHSSQKLLDPQEQLKLLDAFAGEALQEDLKEYQRIYQEYMDKKQAFQAWQMDEQEANQKLDILNFQIDELEEADLKIGEDEELEAESKRLLNYQQVVDALSQSYYFLTGDDRFSALSQIDQAKDLMEGISDLSSDFQDVLDLISSSFYQLEEAQADLSSQMMSLEYDEERLNEIEGRLALIQSLKRKYGETIEEILSFYDQAVQEKENLVHREENASQEEADIERLAKEVLAQGKRVSQQRRDLARRIEEGVHKELQDLYMEKTSFQVTFDKELEDLTQSNARANGLDQVSFAVSTNPGEPLKPLDEVASGGELSRFMLALKTIFNQKQGAGSQILDEVDTGVSGRVASAIGDKIYSLSMDSQVLCITHLPQVAAQADHHLYISKDVADGRTSTHVRYLSEDEKIEELAQMLAGDDLSPSSLQAAKDLRKRK